MPKRKPVYEIEEVYGPQDILTPRDEQSLAKWFLASLPTIIVLAIVIGAFTALK